VPAECSFCTLPHFGLLTGAPEFERVPSLRFRTGRFQANLAVRVCHLPEAFKPFLSVAVRKFRLGRARTPGAPQNILHSALSREDSKPCISWRLADESRDAGSVPR